MDGRFLHVSEIRQSVGASPALMRILHLDSGREMRGGQWQALRLHSGLLQAGHESFLLARRGSPLLDAPSSDILRPLSLASLAGRFDLIHAHDARSHTLAACLLRSPLIVSRRVAFPIRTSPFSRLKYGRPRLFLAVSNCVAQQLGKAQIDENRIAVIYDGVPVPVNPAKGQRILAIDKGTNLSEAAAKHAGVELEKPVNLTADLPGARALLYLTGSEGLGSGILLAMAHGVPVIASNVGGIPELIRHGKNGTLVPNDCGAIAQALRQIDPALGRAARETVRERFTEERMIGATIAAYRRVLADA
jgi:hypothetical protein